MADSKIETRLFFVFIKKRVCYRPPDTITYFITNVLLQLPPMIGAVQLIFENKNRECVWLT